MKKAKLEKSPWVTVTKKPGPKKVKKLFDEAKKLQLAESDKGSWYNQSDFLQLPWQQRNSRTRNRIVESRTSVRGPKSKMPATIQPLSPLLTG